MEKIFRSQPYMPNRKKNRPIKEQEIQMGEKRLGPPAQYERGSVAEELQRVIADRMSGKKGSVRRYLPFR